MINQILQQFDISSIILVAALIAAFVIAFKVMEMIFDTMLIAGISAAFYIGLRVIQGGAISINDVLLFTFLGASVYMTYSFLASLYKIGAKVLPIPIHIIEAVLTPFKMIWTKMEEIKNNQKDYSPKKTRNQKKKEEKKNEEEDRKNQSTKEVILGSQKNKEDEEEE